MDGDRRTVGVYRMSKIVLPYEPDYVGDRETEKRRQETKKWLQQRERELAEHWPCIVPEHAPKPENVS